MIQIDLRAFDIEEAVIHLCSLVKSNKNENLRITEALGRILADDFVTPFPMPPFRRAAMDGYAVQYNDIAEASPNNPVTLCIVDEIKAGSRLSVVNEANQVKSACRIYTGASVPDYYDTIIVQEAIPLDQIEALQGNIQISKPFKQGEHIAEAGEDMASGTTALTKGTPIGAKEIAILASYGQSHISVFKRPKITVIPIGDELLSPGDKVKQNHIFDANSFMVEARACELGASIHRLNPVPDQVEAIMAILKDAIKDSDVVITTGGISVGKYDFVAQAVETIGGLPLFRKVRMRPGKPTSAFIVDEKLVIGLSGNPSACFAGLELLVKPVVMKLAGRRFYHNRYVKGMLTSGVNKPCPFTRFMRAHASWQGDKWLVEPLGNDKSGNIAAFSHANALAVIPSGNRGAAKDEVVNVLLLESL